jgi:hypothetical protein
MIGLLIVEMWTGAIVEFACGKSRKNWGDFVQEISRICLCTANYGKSILSPYYLQACVGNLIDGDVLGFELVLSRSARDLCVGHECCVAVRS